jgi:hypothetical protein
MLTHIFDLSEFSDNPLRPAANLRMPAGKNPIRACADAQ